MVQYVRGENIPVGAQCPVRPRAAARPIRGLGSADAGSDDACARRAARIRTVNEKSTQRANDASTGRAMNGTTADVEGMRTEHIARKSRECNDIDKSNPILYTAVLCVHGCMRMCMHMSDASPCRRVSNLRHTDHRPSASFRTPRYARRRLMRLGGQ